MAAVDVWVDNLNQGDQCIQCSGPHLKDTRTCSYFLLWSLESRDSCVSWPVSCIFRSRAASKIQEMIFFLIRLIYLMYLRNLNLRKYVSTLLVEYECFSLVIHDALEKR